MSSCTVQPMLFSFSKTFSLKKKIPIVFKYLTLTTEDLWLNVVNLFVMLIYHGNQYTFPTSSF